MDLEYPLSHFTNYFRIFKLMNISPGWRQESNSSEARGLELPSLCMHIEPNGEKCDNEWRLCWAMGSPDPVRTVNKNSRKEQIALREAEN